MIIMFHFLNLAIHDRQDIPCDGDVRSICVGIIYTSVLSDRVKRISRDASHILGSSPLISLYLVIVTPEDEIFASVLHILKC